MPDRENVINGLEQFKADLKPFCGNRADWERFDAGLTMLKEQDKNTADIRDVDGLWCDDITFCQQDCERMDCPRNRHHIRDRRVPHSYSVEIPLDCPKKMISEI